MFGPRKLTLTSRLTKRVISCAHTARLSDSLILPCRGGSGTQYSGAIQPPSAPLLNVYDAVLYHAIGHHYRNCRLAEMECLMPTPYVKPAHSNYTRNPLYTVQYRKSRNILSLMQSPANLASRPEVRSPPARPAL